MDWPRLDTRWWNLSFGVAAATTLSACGPLVTLDTDTDSGAGTDTDGDTDNDTDVPPNTTQPPPQCQNSTDCGPGFECIDNVCIPYDDYCNDGGCCYEYCCYDGCCYGECYYYECYSDAECGPGGLCGNYGYGYCEYIASVPPCDGGPMLLPVSVEEGNPDAIVSLSFVDANDDTADDLVVAHASFTTTLYPGSGVVPPSTLPFPGGSAIQSVVSGHFDGDGIRDLAGNLQDGTVAVLSGNGAGGFALTGQSDTGITGRLTVLDWNGDGISDLAGISPSGNTRIVLGDGMSGLLPPISFDDPNFAVSVEAANINADGLDDLAVEYNDVAFVYYGNIGDPGPLVELYAPYHGDRGMAAADFDGGGLTDIVRHTSIDQWVLLDNWRDGNDWYSRQSLLRPAYLGRTGDVSGDGRADLVMLGQGEVSVLQGNAAGGGEPLFACEYAMPLDIAATMLAVGDIDGDGSADIAVANDDDVVVLLSP